MDKQTVPPDPVTKLLETSFLGTPIAVPLEIRVDELIYDPIKDSYRIAWKCADPSDPYGFTEPPEGERRHYLVGSINISRDVLISNKNPVRSLREIIGEATARDVAEFMIAGAHYLKDDNNARVHLSPAQREWLLRAKERGYEDPFTSLPVSPLVILEKMGLLERNPTSFGANTEWRITQAGIDFKLEQRA